MMLGANRSACWGLVLLGSLVAVGVAVALSPLTPLGPVEPPSIPTPVSHSIGRRSDWASSSS